MKRKPILLQHKVGMISISDDGHKIELRTACTPGNTMNLVQNGLLALYKELPPSLKYETALLMLDIAIEEQDEIEEAMKD